MKKLTTLLILLILSGPVKLQAQFAYLEWGSQFGGLSNDYASGIALDDTGNVFMIGWFFAQADFDPGPGIHNLSPIHAAQTTCDIFISKINPQGGLVWVKQIGDSLNDQAYEIHLDDAGNIYIRGQIASPVDMDPGPSVHTLQPSTGSWADFVLKLDPHGNFLWALEPVEASLVRSIMVDKDGNVFLTGNFGITRDFDPGAGIFNLTASGGSDIYISKLNSSGHLQWARSMPGVPLTNRWGNDIYVDSTGYLYVTGSFEDTTDLDPGPGSHIVYASSWGAGFVSKLDSLGNFIWGKTFHPTQYRASGFNVLVAPGGGVLINGSFYGTADFDPGPGTFNLTASTSTGGPFLCKLDKNGDFRWAQSVGGGVSKMLTDPDGNIYAVGSFGGVTDFFNDPLSFTLTAEGLTDAYVSKLDSTGRLQWVRGYGASGYDAGTGIALDDSANVFLCGAFDGSTDFHPWGPENIHFTHGLGDAFLLKVSQSDTLSHVDIVSCDWPTYSPSGQQYWWQGGTYYDTIPKSAGGDSVLHVNLNFLPSHSNNYSVTSCGPFTSPSGKRIWTNNGQYFDTVSNSYGCDSLLIITLTIVNPPASTSFNVSSCNSYTSPSGSYVWTSSGTYNDTVLLSTGCDSVMTINLNILNESSSTINRTECGQMISPSGNYTWTSSGTYLDTIANAAGCDSIVTVNLNILNPSFGNIVDSTCTSYLSPSGRHLWDSTGIYTDTLVNAVGCDSIITVDLKIINPNIPVIFTSACEQFVSPSGNYTWTTSGVYLDTVFQGVGCAGVLTISLTINQPTSSSINVSSCSAYDSPSGKYTWTSSGTYYDTIANAAGCDSIITVNLNIQSPGVSNISVTTCENYTSPSGKHNWTSSGSYVDTVSSTIADCDSILNINLTILSSTLASLQDTSCESYLSPSGNHVWTSSGLYHDTLTNHLGCDSIVSVNLEIYNSSANTWNQTACQSLISPSGTYLWTSSGIYKDTIPNSHGCDSVLTVNLTINNTSQSNVNVSSCSSFASPSGKYVWTANGIYNDTIQNATGCDSIITFHLTILNPSASTIQTAACGSYTSPSGLYNWTSSGTYHDTISNAAGCDSTITVNLTIYNSTQSTTAVSSCSSYTSPSGRYTWTTSGTYQDTISNANGCDSILTLNLTILAPSYYSFSHTACVRYIPPGGGPGWSASGTYTDTIPNAAGCDSIITINLTITSVDTSVIRVGGLFIAVTSGAFYQWLDCNGGYTPIPGANARSFAPIANGSYAVLVVENGCSDTSGCHSIQNVGIEENGFGSSLQLYPNPTRGKVTVELGAFHSRVDVNITSTTGALIRSETFENTDQFDLNFDGAEAYYWIHLRSADGKQAVFKILME